MSPYIYVALSTILGITGQLLLKRGMGTIGQSSTGAAMLKRIVFSPWVIGGLIVYGLGVVNWLLALSSFELSYVYPFASLSYIGIIIGSYFIFRERVTAMRLLGIFVIIAGVLISSRS
ncbi:MAG: multidrug resistance protein [Anaerolineaceae bacterium]|nr:multidrug resistance protein [Anaerolineaceae bacterium]